jgi:hypothetical protein
MIKNKIQTHKNIIHLIRNLRILNECRRHQSQSGDEHFIIYNFTIYVCDYCVLLSFFTNVLRFIAFIFERQPNNVTL